MNILPLSENNIEEAIQLLNAVFPNDIKSNNPPELGLRASLNKEIYKTYWEQYQNVRIEYFVLVNEGGKIIGVTGLFNRSVEPETAWLAWFCIDPKERGMGYGKQLLNFTVDRAQMYGYEYLKIYTDQAESPEAQSLYKKVGFEDVGVIQDPADEMIYLTLWSKKIT